MGYIVIVLTVFMYFTQNLHVTIQSTTIIVEIILQISVFVGAVHLVLTPLSLRFNRILHTNYFIAY